MEPGLASTWPRSTSSRSMPRRRQPTLSPGSPESRVLRNISTPVQTVLRVSVKPTISTSSPGLMTPRSRRPVATGPRADDRNVVAGKAVLGEELADLQLDEVEELRVLHHVHFVEVYHHGRHF